jgi:hypothetical protein
VTKCASLRTRNAERSCDSWAALTDQVTSRRRLAGVDVAWSGRAGEGRARTRQGMPRGTRAPRIEEGRAAARQGQHYAPITTRLMCFFSLPILNLREHGGREVSREDIWRTATLRWCDPKPAQKVPYNYDTARNNSTDKRHTHDCELQAKRRKLWRKHSHAADGYATSPSSLNSFSIHWTKWSCKLSTVST